MTQWVTRLIIANVAVFLLTLASPLFAEFLTFDKRAVNVAANNAPTVKVNLLPS